MKLIIDIPDNEYKYTCERTLHDRTMWDDAIRNGTPLDDVKAENKGEWIPVSERLPEDGAWALFTNGSTISVERYKADAIDHFYPQGRWFSFDNATAWMSLPEPYMTEKGGE